jgi:putative glycosyltransferase (TIGR04372 family)
MISLHKLGTLSHFAWLLFWANLRAVLQGIEQGPRGTLREFRQAAIRFWLVIHAGLFLRGKFRVTRLMRLCESSGVSRAALSSNLEAAVAMAERDLAHQKFEEAEALLTPHIEANPNDPWVAKCHGIRSYIYSWRGNYLKMIEDLHRCEKLRPSLAQGFNYLGCLAQIHGFRGEEEAARRAMAAQCGAGSSEDSTAFLARYLTKWTSPYLESLPLSGTVGIMFGAYPTAVGHAILDPFHFYNLFRHRFDHLVLIHPPRGGYSLSCKYAVDVMEQYIEQIEVEEAKLAQLPWQNLGEITTGGKLTFLCYNYWGLNRLAFRARRDPRHPLNRGRRYLQMPAKLIDRAETICRKNKLKIDRPLVVLHVREHGYHRLKGQAYRNIDVRNYIPALRHLIAKGYLVVRVGDRTMTSLRREVPELVELPTQQGYSPLLDPFLLSRCEFMISCQSGPCSFARAYGKPTLVVNAVCNHTLLPEQNELFVFKQYLDEQSRQLSIEEMLQRGCHLFDRSLHYEEAGIHLEDATAEEILAATEEMLVGLNNPNREDSPAQTAFRDLMRHYGAIPSSHPLANRLSDYIGYGLPEGRVSDAVCQARPGYVSQKRLRPLQIA